MEVNRLIKGIMSLFKNREYFVLLLNLEHFYVFKEASKETIIPLS